MLKLLPLLLILLLSSCISVSFPAAAIDRNGRAFNPGATQYELQKVIKIRDVLLNMDPSVTYQDADAISNMAVYYSQVLANRYKLITPPLLHNTLVNTGFRSRGLCYNWAEDMIKQSRKLNPETLDIYWGVSSPGSMMYEHNSLVITAKGKPFSTGYVLDPWRNSGNVYWVKVGKDPKYKWEDLNAK